MSDAGDSHDGTHAAAAGSSDLPVDDPPSQHRGVPEPSDDAVPSAEDHAYLALVPAPLPAPAHRTPWALVDYPAALARLVTRLRAARIIAIDAEFVQIYDRKPDDPPHRLALLQIAAAAEDPMSFVIDALRIPDLTPLQGPLGDANTSQTLPRDWRRRARAGHTWAGRWHTLESRPLVARFLASASPVCRPCSNVPAAFTSTNLSSGPTGHGGHSPPPCWPTPPATRR